jgi:predicted O-linked N-acetylglucosamine transferase (SPINDLY family)
MLHPAPIQVNYLGYPGTLGGGICDYIITDSYMTPMEAASDYSEAFAYMPHSYQPHGRAGEIGRKPSRSDVGLPDSGFVFCCFVQIDASRLRSLVSLAGGDAGQCALAACH